MQPFEDILLMGIRLPLTRKTIQINLELEF